MAWQSPTEAKERPRWGLVGRGGGAGQDIGAGLPRTPEI